MAEPSTDWKSLLLWAISIWGAILSTLVAIRTFWIDRIRLHVTADVVAADRRLFPNTSGFFLDITVMNKSVGQCSSRTGIFELSLRSRIK